MVTPLSLYDLLDMLPRPGCAVCGLLRRDAVRFLDALLYEFVNDADTQRAFRARRGLCSEHGWALLRLSGGSLGTAILYRAALDQALQVMAQSPLDAEARSGRLRRRAGNDESQRAALASKLKPEGPCAACTHLAAVEALYMQTWREHANDARLLDAFRQSAGLCLPHFRRLLVEAVDPEGVREIVAVQRDIWARLKAELEEFIDKQRDERRREPMGAEGDSWRRVIEALGGGQGVFGVDRRTS